MKKFFIMICLLSFIFSYMPVSYTQENFSDEGFSDGLDTGFDGGDNIDTTDLSTIIDDLDSINSDLEDELEDSPSKPLKQVVRKLDKCLDLLENAQEASEEDEPEDCGDDLERAERLLDKALSTFEGRQCKTERASRKCISIDVVDTYIGDLEDILDTLGEEIELDDDEDGIPDVCGFSEDF